MPSLHFQLLPKEHVERAYAIETAEYPAEEAASLENLIYRQTHAPHLFMGCYLNPHGDNDVNACVVDNSETSHGSTTSFVPTSNDLIGYIVSTQAHGETLTHESMSHHEPTGESVCIHSVCIARAFQRRGYALRMLRAYLAHLDALNRLARQNNNKDGNDPSNNHGTFQRVLLIAHDELVPLYKKAGFEWIGQSEVSHGPDPWFEMKYKLK
ncbi:hypothetical protein BGW42_007182 [Actinomortierella wolfii]|nr:hypothetical protein BGW42_007182 [Actinomortierella wolfii]